VIFELGLEMVNCGKKRQFQLGQKHEYQNLEKLRVTEKGKWLGAGAKERGTREVYFSRMTL
jgi:hypothetical protein